MPAPDLPTLFDFESAIEDPLADYLGNANASWQILTPRTRPNVAVSSPGTDYLRTPRISLSLAVSTQNEQINYSSGYQYYSTHTGTMSVSCVTRREPIDQLQGLLRGTVRQAMLGQSQVWNSNTLPYLQVVDVSWGSSSQGSDEENEEIVTNLTFIMKFFVPPESFP